ncbi:MAG TPA: hypothetical protein VN676_13805 [Steroidobacteraceae bacterium]|nr:hypothetical protein [Steroidobacteraceae bacterium]
MISASAQAGKFVISLCTVAVPITIPQPRSPELMRYRFFLHTCWEEGTRRHRLYMGYFAARADADKWLGTLRRIYPSAFVSTAPEAEMLTNTQIVSLLDQPASTSTALPVRSVPIEVTAQPPRIAKARLPQAAEPRPYRPEARRSEPSLQDTVEALKVSTLDVNMEEEDPLNATGVRHLRIEIQKGGSRERAAKRSGSRK